MNKVKNLNKTTKSNFITYLMVIVAYVVMQALIMGGSISSLMQGLLVPVCVYVILAISLNLTVGILGELSLGHAGFMCVGAFVGALFSKITVGTMPDMVRFTIAVVIGAAAAGLAGILIGIPVLRLKGDYLAIVTLAFGEIIKNVMNILYIGKDTDGFRFSTKDIMALNLGPEGQKIMAGPQGIVGVPLTSTFTAGVVLILICLFIILNLINSRSGRAIMAIRDNRIAAESVGINITKYKMLAFSVSAAMAGVAGVLYSHNLATLTAKNFGYNTSIMALVFVVLGGIGNIRGSIIAAVVLTLLPEMLRGLNDYRMLIYAVVLIAVMLLNWSPKGIELKAKLFAVFKKKNSSKEAA